MDDNIKVAASYVRQAMNNMQSKLQELHTMENREKREESQEEGKITDEMRNDRSSMALNFGDHSKSQAIIAHENLLIAQRDQQLNKNQSKLKSDIDQEVSNVEHEIQSLQGQIKKLDEIARTLEWWHS
jgi:hypothetical protein